MQSSNNKTPRPIFNGQFEIQSCLGEGSTSKVYLAKIIRESLNEHYQMKIDSKQNFVALKVFKDSYLRENSPKSQEVVQGEIEIMKNLHHQNIVNIYGWGQHGQVVKPSGRKMEGITYIVMEYVKGDLLFDFVKDFGGIGEIKSKALMCQLLSCLKYLKDIQVTHRDIKLENIMVSDKLQVKVADFGFAKQGKINKLTSYRGTKTYMAPEIRHEDKYDGLKADIFSTGVVLFAIVTGIFPFTEASSKDKYFSMLKDRKYKEYWQVIDKHSNIKLSSEFKQLMQGMLAFNPNKRPSVEEIINHQWMQSADHKEAQQSIIDMIHEKKGINGDYLSTQESNSSEYNTCH